MNTRVEGLASIEVNIDDARDCSSDVTIRLVASLVDDNHLCTRGVFTAERTHERRGGRGKIRNGCFNHSVKSPSLAAAATLPGPTAY